MAELQPDVAAQFELTSHVTRLHVLRLGQDVNLTQISLEEAEALLALPGGFEWLRRKEVPVNDAGPAVENAGPVKGKKRGLGES